jgi:hypothetical protein
VVAPDSELSTSLNYLNPLPRAIAWQHQSNSNSTHAASVCKLQKPGSNFSNHLSPNAKETAETAPKESRKHRIESSGKTDYVQVWSYFAT